MQHPDEGLIHAWLDGELDAAEAARVEALVASDPAWAAAAAEAHGLIAASARIVGTLDRVPANVIPAKTAPPRRVARQWIWRAAAAVVLVAGSAVVLQRQTPELPVPTQKKAPATELSVPKTEPPVATAPLVPPKQPGPVPAAKRQTAVSSSARTDSLSGGRRPAASEPGVEQRAAFADSKSTILKKELDPEKQIEARRDKDIAAAGGEVRSNAGAASAAAAPRKAADLPAAPPMRSPLMATQALAEEKTTRRPPACFEQRAPADSVHRIIRLEASALDDSIRLEKLTLRGDTLAAVSGPLSAIRVRCPGM